LTVQRLLSVISYMVLSRLLSRRKYRRWLWVTTVGALLFPLTTALATTPVMLLIPAAIGGVVSPGMNIFLTDTLFRASPEDRRPTFVAANSFVSNLTGFVAPLLGTALAESTGIRLVFVAGGILRMAGGLVFWRLGVGAEDT
jgi:MFS family permease